jgi:hypothetical protein
VGSLQLHADTIVLCIHAQRDGKENRGQTGLVFFAAERKLSDLAASFRVMPRVKSVSVVLVLPRTHDNESGVLGTFHFPDSTSFLIGTIIPHHNHGVAQVGKNRLVENTRWKANSRRNDLQQHMAMKESESCSATQI